MRAILTILVCLGILILFLTIRPLIQVFETNNAELREAEQVRLTARCWQAHDLDITVPFWCAQYMAKGR